MPEIRNKERQYEDEVKRQKKPTMDTALTKDESDITREEFHDFLGKISRPDQPQSEQGKSETQESYLCDGYNGMSTR